MDYLRLLMSLW